MEGFYEVAAVSRNGQGLCLRWSVQRLIGSPHAAACEARATLYVVTLAKSCGWTSIELEGDCIQVVNAIRGGVTENRESYRCWFTACRFIFHLCEF